MRDETRRQGIALSHSWDLKFFAALRMSMKGLICGLQINFSKEVDLQIWNVRIMRIYCVGNGQISDKHV